MPLHETEGLRLLRLMVGATESARKDWEAWDVFGLRSWWSGEAEGADAQDLGAEAYSFGNDGSNLCPRGYDAIATEAACEAAAATLELGWNGQSARDDRPGGCWRGTSGNANWNPSTGQGLWGRSVICVSRAGASGTRAPEAEPEAAQEPAEESAVARNIGTRLGRRHTPAARRERGEHDYRIARIRHTPESEREASEAAISWVAAALALRWHEVLRHPWVAGQALGDWIAAHWAWA